MTAYLEKVQEYPNSNFVTFRFANLGRSSYDSQQYNVYNTSTGWSSGWTYAPVSVLGYYSSNFNISLSTGYNYSVYSRMMVNGTWYYGDSWYEPVSFYFTPPARPPTSEVTALHHSSNGRTINIQVTGTNGATYIDWNTPFGSFTRSVRTVPYIESFTAPSFGTEYIIGAYGWNNSGYAPREKLIYSMSEPAIPSINSGGSNNNTITINVSPQGGFTSIEVEMWTIDATSRLAVKTQGWNGGYSFSVQFGGLVANASYLFRARALKTANYGGYSPTTTWGGWLTVKNEITRPVNWKWTTAQNSNGHKISGVNFSMLATEWNSFTQRINEFRKYKGASELSYTTAFKGSDFYFYIFNEANNAINGITSTGLSNVTRGDRVYASYFNALMNALNNIT